MPNGWACRTSRTCAVARWCRTSALLCAAASLAGCGRTTARLASLSGPEERVVCPDERPRPARWARQDERLVVEAEPVPRGPVLCEPYPMVDSLASVSVAAMCGVGRTSGVMVMRTGRHVERLDVTEVCIEDGPAGVDIRARREDRVLQLRVTGPPCRDFAAVDAAVCLALEWPGSDDDDVRREVGG